jgi:transcription elongation GreA/GreB family factor
MRGEEAYLPAMSRAFTREDDVNLPLADIGERPVSQHRNLVTPEGLAEIDRTLASLHEEFAKAEAEGERERMALASRDLRYWTARRETAEVSVPDRASDVARFGMTVTVADEDGKKRKWKIVGEDEADAAKGMISHVSPMAVALFGKAVGETAQVNGREFEIVGLKS